MNIQEQIDQVVKENKIMLFIKGSREQPQCGFSAKVVHILEILEANYECIDVLLDSEICQGIKEYSDWPTIPQLYVNGEFLGGCDIITELYINGELDGIIKGESN